MFEICSVTGFYYKELKADLEGCLQKVAKEVEPTQEELTELKGYMHRFLEDVEADKSISLIEKIKEAPFEEIPNLCAKLHDIVVNCHDMDDYGDTLKELDLISKIGDGQFDSIKEAIETPVGIHVLNRRIEESSQASKLEKTNRFQILKDTL